MDSVRLWIKRHPLLAAVAGLFILVYVVSLASDPRNATNAILGYVLIFAIIWFIAWMVDRRKGYVADKRSMTVPARPAANMSLAAAHPAASTNKSQRRSSTNQGRSAIQSNQTYLAGLDNPTRIGIINMLQLDEAIQFVLKGENGTLVGTDRALLLIPPGRKGFEQRVSASYFNIDNVRIDPSRAGGHLRFDVGGQTHQIHLMNQDQLDRGLMAAQHIRQSVHDAHVTNE